MSRLDGAFILRTAKKLKAVEILGGKCIRCKQDNIACLCFHHKEIEEKEDIVAVLLYGRWSNIESEIKKCDLLCQNCHRVEHAQLEEVTHKQRNKKVLLEAVQKFKCEKCGFESNYNALDFHHNNKGDKEHTFARLSLYFTTVTDLTKKLLDELTKCKVLCANCHKIEHFDWNRYALLEKEIAEKVKSYKEHPAVDPKRIVALYKGGVGYKKIMQITKCSRATIWYYCHNL